MRSNIVQQLGNISCIGLICVQSSAPQMFPEQPLGVGHECRGRSKPGALPVVFFHPKITNLRNPHCKFSLSIMNCVQFQPFTQSLVFESYYLGKSSISLKKRLTDGSMQNTGANQHSYHFKCLFN